MAKKATAKKPATRKPAARKTTARKTATRKATTRKTATRKTTARKTTANNSRGTRRPAANQPPQPLAIDQITDTVMRLIEEINEYTANLRALDRQRHNGVGLKRLGFIQAAFRISKQFPQYFPHWLDTMKFQNDLMLFESIRSLVEACRSLEEKAWNINVESADMIYTDALEYYAPVENAAKRRVDAAETIFAELHSFFERGSYKDKNESEAAPTQKKAKRDINALMKGKKDGEIIIRNISPKTIGGRHEIIDETFNKNISFKDTEEGRIN
jgi:hypothetical protein